MRASRTGQAKPWLIVLAIAATTAMLRVWRLGSAVPWLWYDEAGNGLDARELLAGQFRVFFSRSLGKEPLFNYLVTPFVAAMDGEAVAVRLAAAVMGVVMVPLLYACSLALWPDNRRAGIWMGLLAAGWWAVNYWPQSINRISFRANMLPVLLTAAMIAWISWTRAPSRRRALLFGLLAGLTLNTYLAARATLLLWPALYVTLPACTRKALRAHIAWAALATGAVVAPLATYLALHPQEMLFRVGTATALSLAGGPSELIAGLVGSVTKVSGVFVGLTGDPLTRHNLPGYRPFLPPLAAFFVVGLVCALAGWRRRDGRGSLLLLWWGVMSLPAVLAAEGNPHSLRLFGALPAALLIAALPVGWLVARVTGPGLQWVPERMLRWLGIGLFVLVVGEGLWTAQRYFGRWAHDTDLYPWFQGDIWSYGTTVHASPGTIGLVSQSPYFYTLDYAFQPADFLRVSVEEDRIEGELRSLVPALRDARVAVPVWREGLLIDADPKDVLPFYLAREGVLIGDEALRGFNVFTFQLGGEPEFDAGGQRVASGGTFANGLQLAKVRWGAAYPNADRGSDTAAAGTALWAVLTWRMAGAAQDLKVALDLTDQAGHRLAADEELLLSADHLPTSRWSADTVATSYHLVSLPRTQPRGTVRLSARVYDAATLAPIPVQGNTGAFALPLADARSAPALQPAEADDLRLSPGQAVAPGLTFLGIEGLPEVAGPGELLSLRLYWQAQPGWSPQTIVDRCPALELEDGSARAVTCLPDDLTLGRVLHTYADLRLPPDARRGVHQLDLVMRDGVSVPVGSLTIEGRGHSFAPPALSHPVSATFGNVVMLLGLDAPANLMVRPGQTISLTLAWQPLATPTQDLKRFVHLLGADGRPLAQEDALPCGGACIAPSWLPDEVLVEQARLEIPANVPAGRYSVGTGWYDSISFTRLAVLDAAGQRATDDLLILPLFVEVAP